MAKSYEPIPILVFSVSPCLCGEAFLRLVMSRVFEYSDLLCSI
jgi:hypothetical protein